MTTNNAVDTNLSGQTGTGSFAGSLSPIFTTPSLGGSFLYGNTTSAGNLNLSSTSNVTKGFIYFGSLESAYDETNVRLGIGTTTPATGIHLVENSVTTLRGLLTEQYSTGTNGIKIYSRKARGTYASPTVIVSGDTIGSHTFSGYDGTQFTDCAKILVNTTGTISTGIIPSTLSLQTMNSSGVLANALNLDSSQNMQANIATVTGVINAVGAVGTPSYTFSGDTTTGFYHPASSQIAAAIGGVQAMLLTSTGEQLISGTAANPSLSFIGNTNTGIYKPTTNQLGISCNGILQATFATTGFIFVPSVTISATTNQLVLGTTNTTTITSTAPAASRTYTINDLLGNGNFILSGSMQVFTAYNGTATMTKPIVWMGTATTTTGAAVFHPTSDGTSTGTAIFTNILSVQATPAINTTTAVDYPFASLQAIAAGNQTVTINVGVGTTLLALGATTKNAPNGTTVYLTLIGN